MKCWDVGIVGIVGIFSILPKYKMYICKRVLDFIKNNFNFGKIYLSQI